MPLIDLSRDIYHKMPRILTHPPIIITPFGTHEEVREADGYKFSSATLSLAMGDHAGTHVDAPVHFDARPGAKSIQLVSATSREPPSRLREVALVSTCGAYAGLDQRNTRLGSKPLYSNT